MIEYRHFRNGDPPKLVELWHACDLGRGAALDFSYDALDRLNFAQPYFDPAGLMLACQGDQVAGFVHAGFGCNSEETALSDDVGVICALMVRPSFRRTGIGRKLVELAEQYLAASGVSVVYAGPAPQRDPFYVGLYGGSQVSGFLESDTNAAPFIQALGYAPVERYLIFQRPVNGVRAPVSFRLSRIQRKTELEFHSQPHDPSWWWMTRYGRLDTLLFELVPSHGGEPLARVSACGLDLYMSRWQQRIVGLSDLVVVEAERRQGYGQALIVEIVRRLREEMVTQIETHVLSQNQAARELLKSVGFKQVDAGIVYRKGPLATNAANEIELDQVSSGDTTTVSSDD